MSSIFIATPAHFLAGLALLTLAAMACAVLGRAATRPFAAWGLSTLIALALAEWCDLAGGGATRPAVWQSARLALDAAALVGLIELGRLCTTGRRGGLLPRWTYLLVAALSLAAVLLDGLYPLAFALRLGHPLASRLAGGKLFHWRANFARARRRRDDCIHRARHGGLARDPRRTAGLSRGRGASRFHSWACWPPWWLPVRPFGHLASAPRRFGNRDCFGDARGQSALC